MLVFIQLEQRWQGDARADLKYVMFYVLDNGGKRCAELKRGDIKGFGNGGRPTNERIVSGEVRLDTPGKEYTLMVSTLKPGQEIGYMLTIFSPEPVTVAAFPDNSPECQVKMQNVG